MLFWRFTGKYLRSHWKHWQYKLSNTGYFFFSLYFILGKVLTVSYACCIAISLLTRSYVLPKKMKRRVSTTSDTQDQLNRQANYIQMFIILVGGFFTWNLDFVCEHCKCTQGLPFFRHVFSDVVYEAWLQFFPKSRTIQHKIVFLKTFLKPSTGGGTYSMIYLKAKNEEKYLIWPCTDQKQFCPFSENKK